MRLTPLLLLLLHGALLPSITFALKLNSSGLDATRTDNADAGLRGGKRVTFGGVEAVQEHVQGPENDAGGSPISPIDPHLRPAAVAGARRGSDDSSQHRFAEAVVTMGGEKGPGKSCSEDSDCINCGATVGYPSELKVLMREPGSLVHTCAPKLVNDNVIETTSGPNGTGWLICNRQNKKVCGSHQLDENSKCLVKWGMCKDGLQCLEDPDSGFEVKSRGEFKVAFPVDLNIRKQPVPTDKIKNWEDHDLKTKWLQLKWPEAKEYKVGKCR